jgi:hypothetical protein
MVCKPMDEKTLKVLQDAWPSQNANLKALLNALTEAIRK